VAGGRWPVAGGRWPVDLRGPARATVPFSRCIFWFSSRKWADICGCLHRKGFDAPRKGRLRAPVRGNYQALP
jgi:hypothetical protein